MPACSCCNADNPDQSPSSKAHILLLLVCQVHAPHAQEQDPIPVNPRLSASCCSLAAAKAARFNAPPSSGAPGLGNTKSPLPSRVCAKPASMITHAAPERLRTSPFTFWLLDLMRLCVGQHVQACGHVHHAKHQAGALQCLTGAVQQQMSFMRTQMLRLHLLQPRIARHEGTPVLFVTVAAGHHIIDQARQQSYTFPQRPRSSPGAMKERLDAPVGEQAPMSTSVAGA